MQKKGLLGLVANVWEMLTSLIWLAALPGGASKSRGSGHKSRHLGERARAVHNIHGRKGEGWNEAFKELKRKEVGNLELEESSNYF